MTYTQLRKILACINLAVVFFMLADSYLFPPCNYKEVVSKKTVEENYSRNHSYFTWHLITTAGNKFGIPSITYTKLNPGDIITVSRTAILKKAVEISYSYQSDEFGIDDGVIKGSWLGKIAALIIIIISAWLLFFHQTIRQEEDVKLRILLLATFVLVPLIYYYFIEQP